MWMTRFFFGREALVQWLLNEVRPATEGQTVNRFLAIVGASGSGKSSVARAGLVAALKRNQIPGSASWPVAIFRPGSDPLENLSVALSKVVNVGQGVSALAELIAAFQKNEKTLHLTARQALPDDAPDQRMVVVVDQFEEVFTLCRKAELRDALIGNLLYATKVAQGQTLVILTMRADFYGKCAAHAELAAALSDHHFLVGPMTEDELRRAIERPALLVGGELDAGLVDLLLQDVRRQPGALPLLQHALLELWNKREGRRLSVKAYQEIGKLDGALQRRADATLKAFSPEEQELCRRTFLRLTQPGEGAEDTKRRASLQELLSLTETERSTAEEAVIQKLADASLLTTEGALTREDACVEVAHEALIRNWPQLRKWIDVDRAGLRTRTRLTEATQEWNQSGRDPTYLYAGARLAVAEEWASLNAGELSIIEAEFLQRSLEAQKQQKAKELAAAERLALAEAARAKEAENRVNEQKRAAQKLLRWALAAGCAAVAALLLLVLSVHMWQTSESAALRAQEQARINMVEKLAADLTPASADRNILCTCQLIKALQHPGRSGNPLRLERAMSVLDDELERRRFLFETHWNYDGPASSSDVGDVIPVRAVAYSPDGNTLVLGDNEGRVRILRDGVLGDPIRVGGGSVWTLAFSPDGDHVAIGAHAGSISVLNLRDPAPKSSIAQLELPGVSGQIPAVWSCSWNDKGDLAAGCQDGKIYVWLNLVDSLRSGKPRLPVIIENRVGEKYVPVHAVAWVRSSPMLAIGDAAGKLRIWDGQSLSERVKASENAIWSLASSEDGRLACASWDRSISIWKVELAGQGPALSRLWWKQQAHDQYVRDVAWLDNDRTIASVGDDGMLKYWRSSDLSALDTELSPIPGIWRLCYSASAKMIATANDDGAVRIYRLALPQPDTHGDHVDDVICLAFMNSSLLSFDVTGGCDIFDPRSRKEEKAKIPQYLESGIRTVRFQPRIKAFVAGYDLSSEHRPIQGQLAIWYPASIEKPRRVDIQAPIASLACHPTESIVAFLTSKGDLGLKTLPELEAVSDQPDFSVIQKPETHRVVADTAWSSAGDVLLLALNHENEDASELLRFHFDGKKLTAISPNQPIRIPARIASFEWHPSDDQLVAIGTTSGAVMLYSFSVGQTKPIVGHEGAVNTLHWSVDGHQIFTGADADPYVKVWAYNPEQEEKLVSVTALRHSKGHVLAISVCPEGNGIYTAGTDPKVLYWPESCFSVNSILARAQHMVNRNMFNTEWLLYRESAGYSGLHYEKVFQELPGFGEPRPH
jgi:WD40 repeat protein